MRLTTAPKELSRSSRTAPEVSSGLHVLAPRGEARATGASGQPSAAGGHEELSVPRSAAMV